MLDLIKRKFITFLVLLTAIVIVISLIVSSVFGGNGKADFLSNTFSVVISPLQGSLSWVTGNISDVFSFFGQITTSYNENKELKKQVLTLQRDIENIQEYKDENTRLRNLLDLQSQLTNYQTISAEVVARDISGHSGIIKINKGSNHGIAQNDVIMSAGGLVGYISEVGSTWSSVTTITSSASHVSCTLPRIGEITLLSGGYSEYENGICSMDFV
ncbi:MAG: rod shape-determining protein MreC, partial [Clostridia bacterium]|nr:rod shape-determining protein MreC [Clostridia bacterium]